MSKLDAKIKVSNKTVGGEYAGKKGDISTMKYEVVTLEQKTVVGVSGQTSNSDPQIGEKINALWTELYKENRLYMKIKNKSNEYSIGLYSNYNDDGYTVTAGFEVTKNENPELTEKKVPAGKYAKFFVRGDMQKAVADAWTAIGDMDLPRSYTGDFEEYLNADMTDAMVNIYVALK